MTDYQAMSRAQLIETIHGLEQRVDTLSVAAERLSLLMENSSDYIMIADGDGKPVLFNRAYADIMKKVLDLDMQPGIQPHKLLDDPQAVAYWDRIHERVLSGERFSEEFDLDVPGQGKHSFILSFYPITQDGKVVGFSEISKDITPWRQVEVALRQSEARFRTVIENIPFELFTIDRDGRYAMQNWVCRELRGDITGKTPVEVAPDEKTRVLWEKNNHRAFTGETIREDVRIDHPEGERWLHNIIAPILENDEVQGILGINIDITERKRTEEELLRAQRLDSLGVLAGGIAHDFNNLLSGVFGFIDLARESLDPRNSARAYLENAMDAYSLARGLTNQLLTFSRGGAPVKSVISIQPLLRNATQLALSGANVSVRYEFVDDLHRIEADEGQIAQVVNNIVINARQAMPAGGTVTVRARNRRLTRQEVPQLEPGDYVETTISDEGCGIPAGIVEKIFDPFFTTKQQGSGLGLAISYSIVNRHGGHLGVSSSPETGSDFYILLPAAVRTGDFEIDGGRGFRTVPARILLMDDEPVIRQVGMSMLDALGCKVVVAADGAEAVTLYNRAREENNPFDAVILDLTVPGGMGGQEAVNTLIKTDPAVRAIATTGYADSPVLADFHDYGFAGVLAKPYRLESMAGVLASVLGQND